MMPWQLPRVEKRQVDKKSGFTMVEVMIAVAIFTAVMGLVLVSVVGLFRTLRSSQQILDKEQKLRLAGLHLSKEIASLVRPQYGKISFAGESNEFFIVFAKDETLAESKYAYNPDKFTLEHSFEEPSDYDMATCQSTETVLENLAACKFSYHDGAAWLESWDENKTGLPRAIKISFKFKDEDKERELLVNVPVSQ
ncbi:MAG: prepilin-type N-terminal cleavage/methylation domain-containing protein [Candidatus Omnitrophica bacterium]|nr:prepilin-type N-terminal cleavage/methylation domain-containing protein [Candidatus Omnitrophota bacterium]MBI5145445.1 prepilin-type N-terminal cleavage/methylation domain-containing protein [Candidatus Omnitrophota bacterium]